MASTPCITPNTTSTGCILNTTGPVHRVPSLNNENKFETITTPVSSIVTVNTNVEGQAFAKTSTPEDDTSSNEVDDEVDDVTSCSNNYDANNDVVIEDKATISSITPTCLTPSSGENNNKAAATTTFSKHYSETSSPREGVINGSSPEQAGSGWVCFQTWRYVWNTPSARQEKFFSE